MDEHEDDTNYETTPLMNKCQVRTFMDNYRPLDKSLDDNPAYELPDETWIPPEPLTRKEFDDFVNIIIKETSCTQITAHKALVSTNGDLIAALLKAMK